MNNKVDVTENKVMKRNTTIRIFCSGKLSFFSINHSFKMVLHFDLKCLKVNVIYKISMIRTNQHPP